MQACTWTGVPDDNLLTRQMPWDLAWPRIFFLGAGNYPFLPRNAAILDIAPATHHHTWAASLVADMQSLNWTLIDLPEQSAPWLALAPGGLAETSSPKAFQAFLDESLLTDQQR